MLRRTLRFLVASKPPTPKKPLHERYGVALLGHPSGDPSRLHPETIEVPENFKWTHHVFGHKALPRGTSGEPMHVVLSVLFYNQPCRIVHLWDLCRQIPFLPLDSRRHLRLVVHQARMEGWIYFEKNSQNQWYIYPTRERYNEMKDLVTKWREDWLKRHQDRSAPSLSVGKAQQVATKRFSEEMTPKQRTQHLEKVQKELLAVHGKLRQYERTYIDYLPYTDPNGKVQFMWWYDTTGSQKFSNALLSDSPTSGSAVQGAFVTGSARRIAGLQDPTDFQERTRGGQQT